MESFIECPSLLLGLFVQNSNIWNWAVLDNRLDFYSQVRLQKNVVSQIKSSTYYSYPYISHSDQFSSVQSVSHVRLFATPWITARQASLSITNSWSSLRLTSIESVMPSSYFILCHPLLLLPPIPPRIRVFSNESTLLMRWPKYWSFSISKTYYC